MDSSRRFANLVLKHIKRVGDIHEHDEAGRLLAELEERDYKSPKMADEADASVAETPQPGDAGTGEGKGLVSQEPANDPPPPPPPAEELKVEDPAQAPLFPDQPAEG
jgi:hypothetical protein